MPKELGDALYTHVLSITLPSDGTGSAGDFVTFDSSDQVTPVAASDDDIVGVLGDDSPDSAGEKLTVHVSGVVAGNVATGTSTGAILQPDGTNAGRTTGNSQGTTHSVDEGGTAIYDLAPANPMAFSPEGGEFMGATLAANTAAVRLR